MQSAARFVAGFFESGGSVRQKAVRGTLWVLLSRGLTKPILFVQTVILVRLLSPSDFGLVGLLFVITGTIDVFVAPGMQTAVIQRKEVDRTTLNTAWVAGIAGGIIKAVLLILLAPYAATFYNTPILEKIINLYAVTYLVGSFKNIGMVVYTRDINVKMITLAEQLTAILQAVFTIIFGFLLRNVWALVFGYVIGSVVSILLSYVISPYRPSFKFDMRIARGLFRFGRYVFISGILVFIINKGDRALLGKLVDLDALGFYTLAYGLAILPGALMAGIIGQVIFPAFSRVNEQPSALKKGYLSIVKFVSLVTIPGAAGVCLLAPEIVGVVYGQKWMPMVNALRILCVLGMIRPVHGINVAIFQGTGRPEFVTLISAIRLSLMALMIYPLTVRYGITGMSVAVVVPMLVTQAWSFQKASAIIQERLSIVVRVLALPFTGISFMAVILMAIKLSLMSRPSIVWLAALIILGGTVYSVVVLVLDRNLVGEMRGLMRGFRNAG